MLGLMQDCPSLTHTILYHGAQNRGGRKLVTRSVEGPARRGAPAHLRRQCRGLRFSDWDGVSV